MGRHAVLAFLVGVILGIAFVAMASLAIGGVLIGVMATVAKIGTGGTPLASVDPIHALLIAPVVAVLALVLGALGVFIFRRL